MDYRLASIGVLTILVFTVQATAVSPDNSNMEPEVFECNSSTVPETSVLDKFSNDLYRMVDAEGLEEKHPDECVSWQEEYVFYSNDNNNRYVLEVLGYKDEEEAVVTLERNSNPVRYANVELNGEVIGATDAHGVKSVDLEDEFRIVVNTSDGDLKLEGRN